MNKLRLSRQAANASAGFTLVELMIVVGIIGILSAIATPMIMSWLPNMRLKTAARNLFSDMQRVRMEAIKVNRDQAIVFDTVNSRYLLRSNPGPGGWADLVGVGGVTIDTVDLTRYGSGVAFGHGNAPAGNSATTPPGPFPADEVSYGTNVLVFNSRGIGNAGYVYLQNQNLGAYAIGTQTSGVVLVRRWMGGDWQ